MSELSRFVYIKSHVTLHVKSNAEKVNCYSPFREEVAVVDLGSTLTGAEPNDGGNRTAPDQNRVTFVTQF